MFVLLWYLHYKRVLYSQKSAMKTDVLLLWNSTAFITKFSVLFIPCWKIICFEAKTFSMSRINIYKCTTDLQKSLIRMWKHIDHLYYFTRVKKWGCHTTGKFIILFQVRTQVFSDIIAFCMKLLLLWFNICIEVLPEEQLIAL